MSDVERVHDGIGRFDVARGQAMAERGVVGAVILASSTMKCWYAEAASDCAAAWP